MHLREKGQNKKECIDLLFDIQTETLTAARPRAPSELPVLIENRENICIWPCENGMLEFGCLVHKTHHGGRKRLRRMENGTLIEIS